VGRQNFAVFEERLSKPAAAGLPKIALFRGKRAARFRGDYRHLGELEGPWARCRSRAPSLWSAGNASLRRRRL